MFERHGIRRIWRRLSAVQHRKFLREPDGCDRAIPEIPDERRPSLGMKGLRFECQPGCTNCCTQKGFVYLTEADLQGIAKFLGMRAIEFERRYVYRTKR